MQNDPAWAADTIGNTSSKIGGKGCLISCVASALCNLSEDVTPQELNQKLTAADGFDGADLIWYKLHEVFPSIDYEYSREFSSQTIEADLQSDRLPIVNVRVHGIGATHWVVIIGAQNGEFMIYDPLNQDKQPIPLSTHGRVYAYRVLKKA